MDLTWIGVIAAAVIGSGVLYWRLTPNKLKADTSKAHAETRETDAKTRVLEAQAEETDAKTLISIIGVLRGEMDRLAKRLADLEERVTALELENRWLKQLVDKFRSLVRRLWAIVTDNGLEADGDLAEAVYEALEDSAP